MLSCVKIITPGGTFPGDSTITGINDSRTGVAFQARTVILVGGYAAPDTLEYQGPDDSAYQWDFGMMHDTGAGSAGGGICHDFGIKVASTAAGYGFVYLDTWPDIFFGGYIGGYGYVSNNVPGSMTITWLRRDRNGDSRLAIFLGGDDYEAQVNIGFPDGVTSTLSDPQGFISLPSGVFSLNNAGPIATGAGGTSWEVGWAAKENLVQSAAANASGNQNGNSRYQLAGQFSTSNTAIATAFGVDTVTVSASTSSGGAILTFCGANVVIRAGYITAPLIDGDVDFNVDCDPALIFFQTTGQLAGAGNDTTQAAGAFGCVDPDLSQGSFWSGDITVGVSPPVLLGARWLSSHYAIQTGSANGGSTTFANKMTVSSIDSSGDVTSGFVSTDGSTPQIFWFAIGTAITPIPPVEPDHGAGIYKLIPERLNDEIYLDPENDVRALFKIPDPNAYTSLIGDE